MDDVFKSAVDSVSYQPGTRGQVVEAYQDKYGADNWKREIVNDILKAHPEMKRASVQREFQYDKRLGMERYKSEKVTAKTADRYKGIGENLPRVLKQDSIKITVKGKQSNGHGGERKRTISRTLTGDKAKAWVNNPNYSDIWGDEWAFFGEDDEDGGSGSMYDRSVSA